MRHQTRQITVRGLAIGGGAPVVVQSMTNTKTADVDSTLAQISRLEQAGCQMVRLAVPDMEAAQALAQIRRRTDMALVADIHFDYRLALASVQAGVDKIRLNPGNIGGADRVRQVAMACKERGIPIRIGVNRRLGGKGFAAAIRRPAPAGACRERPAPCGAARAGGLF